MEDLADGVVEHIGRLEPDVGQVYGRRVAVFVRLRLGLDELGDVQADGDDRDGHHVDRDALRR